MGRAASVHRAARRRRQKAPVDSTMPFHAGDQHQSGNILTVRFAQAASPEPLHRGALSDISMQCRRSALLFVGHDSFRCVCFFAASLIGGSFRASGA